MAESIEGDTEIAYTVGHSTHSLERLAEILRANGVRQIADVRRMPRSRRLLHFNAESLAHSLPDAGIAYAHLPELGGFRKPLRDSPNAGWENDSFRGYADYMRSDEFVAALERLMTSCRQRPTAVMCAEALWYRCHRRLIADALTARRFDVFHIRSDGRSERHVITEFAVVDGDRVSYPPAQGSLGV
jgi:uncharacterized protein (DUF488 family)